MKSIENIVKLIYFIYRIQFKESIKNIFNLRFKEYNFHIINDKRKKNFNMYFTIYACIHNLVFNKMQFLGILHGQQKKRIF